MKLTDEMTDRLRRAVAFDPNSVVLGTRVIDWGSFGFGSTVTITPSLLGVGNEAVRKAGARWAKNANCDFHYEVIDEGRRVSVAFTRKSMAVTSQSQGQWLGAIVNG